MRIPKVTILAIILALVLVSEMSAISYGYLAGSEIDTRQQIYSYTGLLIQIPTVDKLKLLGKVWGDLLTYSDVVSPAFQTAVGLQYADARWYTGISAGWEYRNDSTGTQNNLVLQAEYDIWMKTETNIDLITSYNTHNNTFWGRGRVKQEAVLGQIPWRFGGECIGLYGHGYQLFQAGPVIESLFLSRSLSVAIHGGLKLISNSTAGAYGGLELYYGF